MADKYINISQEKKQTVYIDVSIMRQLLFLTGIQRVVKEIILQLYKYDDLNLIYLDYDEKRRTFIKVSDYKFLNSLRKGICPKTGRSSNDYITPEEFEKNAVFFELDATWMCKLRRSYLYPILKRRGVKIIVHIYDIISVTHPQFFADLPVYRFLDYFGATLNYADKIICNAHATKRDIDEVSARIGIKAPETVVVPLGANFTEGAGEDESIPQNIRVAVNKNRYILMVGTIEPRKNHKLLLDAYDAGLRKLGYNIILAGTPGWKNDEFMDRLSNHEDFDKRILLLTKQPDYVIDYLYKNARFVAFLSYKEGFGLPIIEALAKGVPVIASDTPINREIGGDKCIYFPQDNPSELCRQVELIDDTRYNELKSRLKGFTYVTWEMAGEQIKNNLI